jgi:5,10-methylene-tetrahydrofolate dehydrogenase/methenyl tetrahydrofolate cyclohydrolase
MSIKILDGDELAGYIKERQAHEVRSLRQSQGAEPRINFGGLPESWLSAIKEYAADILVDVSDEMNMQDLKETNLTAVLWLLAGYNIEIRAGRQVCIIGDNEILRQTLTDMEVQLTDTLADADVLIIAASDGETLYPNDAKPGAAIINVSANLEAIAESVYDRDDIKITPPTDNLQCLKICALFEDTIRLARETTQR